MIQLNEISKSYQNNSAHVLRDISLTIHRGQALAILGSSGSGKSTLLKLLNREIEPSTGEVLIDGRNIRNQPIISLRQQFGVVFQQDNLFPHMTVQRNIAIQLELQKQPKKRQIQTVKNLMALVDLDYSTYASRYPDELSGGQRQRVGIARALSMDPEYLLMDEPFSALDAVTRQHLQQSIQQLQRTLHKTIVFVTHDIEEAFTVGDRIAVMHKGRIEQIGDKAAFKKTMKTPFVKQLLDNYV